LSLCFYLLGILLSGFVIFCGAGLLFNEHRILGCTMVVLGVAGMLSLDSILLNGTAEFWRGIWVSFVGRGNPC
jgi:hypothetical protein